MPVRIQREALCPGWECGHELASISHGEAGIFGFFDDDFVVHMHHNLVPRLGDCVHASDEQIASDRLYDILDEFPAVGFELSPTSGGSRSGVGDGCATPPVLTQAWLDVSKSSSLGQFDEENAGLG